MERKRFSGGFSKEFIERMKAPPTEEEERRIDAVCARMDEDYTPEEVQLIALHDFHNGGLTNPDGTYPYMR